MRQAEGLGGLESSFSLGSKCRKAEQVVQQPQTTTMPRQRAPSNASTVSSKSGAEDQVRSPTPPTSEMVSTRGWCLPDYRDG